MWNIRPHPRHIKRTMMQLVKHRRLRPSQYPLSSPLSLLPNEEPLLFKQTEDVSSIAKPLHQKILEDPHTDSTLLSPAHTLPHSFAADAPSSLLVRQYFVAKAVPMIGVGIMDQTI